MTGTDGDDLIQGGTADDTISGLSGNDLLSGGAGNDSLSGGQGFDTVLGGAGDDRIDLSDGQFGDTDIGRGGDGHDTITSSQGDESIEGGDGNDVLSAIAGTVTGGAGDDMITLSNGFTSGGAGADRFVLGLPGDQLQGQNWTVTINDFAAGIGGDQLDLSSLLSGVIGDRSGSPYGRYIWLERTESSTLIVYDRDASGNQYSAQTVAVLQNLLPEALKTSSFAGGIIPPIGRVSTDATVIGSEGNDTLAGGWGFDTIKGGGGDDYISDASNNYGNTLWGEAGNDTLIGGGSPDTLDGGSGDDLIRPGGGSDQVQGGDGNDQIDLTYNASYSTATVDGGAGNDTIIGGSNGDQIQGGAGDDLLTAVQATMAGGDGNDTLSLASGQATGGAGSDRFKPTPIPAGNYYISGMVTITDFAAGAGGDLLDLSGLLSSLVGYRPGDTTGRYIWLEYNGDGTMVKIDEDAAGGTYTGRTVAFLTGVKPADLTANFTGGIVPTITRDASNRSQTGTTANDTLVGGWGNDTITGADGNDTISDTVGTNQLSGGAGNDTIIGLGLRDTIDGGDGNDVLSGGSQASVDGGTGNDVLEAMVGGGRFNGGAGNDTIYGHFGAEYLDGGDGNDLLQSVRNLNYYDIDTAVDTLHGGAGNDTIIGAGMNDLLYGDDGDDTLTAGTGTMTLEGGAGNDRLEAMTGTLTGGTGADRFAPNGLTYAWYSYTVAAVTITDFNAAQGDTIDLSKTLPYLYNFAGGTMPLARYFQIVQDGADTLLKVDIDPFNEGAFSVTDTGYLTLARLQNVTAGSLTAASFIGGLDPAQVAQFMPHTLTGSAAADILVSSHGNDVIDGGSGIDAIYYDAPGSAVDSRFTVMQRPNIPGGAITILDRLASGFGADSATGVELLIVGDRISLVYAPSLQRIVPGTYDHALFGEAEYLAYYPDVAAAVAKGQFASGEAHYLAMGRNEGRIAPIDVTKSPQGLFDSRYYLMENPDVAAMIGPDNIPDAWTHFLLYGEKEGRDPNILFDTDWYLGHNPDVAAAVATGGIDALTHYALYGWKEGRDPSRFFDTSVYLAENPDVAAAGINPLLHFLAYGYTEGRVLHYSGLI